MLDKAVAENLNEHSGLPSPNVHADFRFNSKMKNISKARMKKTAPLFFFLSRQTAPLFPSPFFFVQSIRGRSGPGEANLREGGGADLAGGEDRRGRKFGGSGG